MPSTIRVGRVCEQCSSEFRPLKKEVTRGKGRFCSVGCANTHRANSRPCEHKTKWRKANATTDPYLVAQRRAGHEVEWAIATGRLVRQPCEKCGATKVDAHHDDYSKPLDVRWLCRKHHLEHHRGNSSA